MATGTNPKAPAPKSAEVVELERQLAEANAKLNAKPGAQASGKLSKYVVGPSIVNPGPMPGVAATAVWFPGETVELAEHEHVGHLVDAGKLLKHGSADAKRFLAFLAGRGINLSAPAPATPVVAPVLPALPPSIEGDGMESETIEELTERELREAKEAAEKKSAE